MLAVLFMAPTMVVPYTLLPPMTSPCVAVGDCMPATLLVRQVVSYDDARMQKCLQMSGSMYGSAQEEEDWVKARMQEEDEAFRARRESAQSARAAAWMEEERAIRETAPHLDDAVYEAHEGQRGGNGASQTGSTEYGGSFEAPMQQNDPVAEYEARMRELSRPKTAEDKREAYHKEMLRQIAAADAMDERLRQKRQQGKLWGDSLE